jgi:transposase-like protein
LRVFLEALMKRTPGKTTASKEKYWEKIIEAARRYPQGVTQYCRVMNVSKDNYYQWFKRLRAKHPEWHDLSNRPEIIASNTATGYAREGSSKLEPSSGQERANNRPDTEVVVRPRRRKWTAADRERVLDETDSLSGPDLAAALRREGLYVHILNKWRTQRDLVKIATEKKTSAKGNPLSAENKRLKEENERLQKRLKKANEIIDLQKKISEVLGIALTATDES